MWFNTNTHCDDHPLSSERYDWVERRYKITKGFDRYINRQLIHSRDEDVAKKEKVSYEIIESAPQRCVKKDVDWMNYTELTTLGIDETALRKDHNEYVVIVSAKNKKGDLSVIAVLPNRLKETIKAFLESIPERLRKTVNSVCTDMCDGFVQSACGSFGERIVVIDRYHVSKLYREPLDQLHISEMKRLKSILPHEEYTKLDNMMWIV